ncbi:MAG: 30S ribosomal protein S3 [Patescibacteria group bacterium]
MGNNDANIKDPSQMPKSVWFATKKSYATLLKQDIAIRKHLAIKLKPAGIVEVIIKRYIKRVEITVYATKPGIIIGKAGASINILKADLLKKFQLPQDTRLDVAEIKNPYTSAKAVADEISFMLQKGTAVRRVCKFTMDKVKQSGIPGCKIVISGRINGAEIAREEKFAYGSIPRHTIDANIDHAHNHCKTVAGILGVSVMMYKGDKLTNFNS